MTRGAVGVPAASWRVWLQEHWGDPLYRQSYLMLASTGASAASGLLFWILAAHRSPADVLGVAAGLVAAVAFLSYLTSFALPYAMLRYGGADSVSGLVNLSLVFSAVTSLLAAAVFALVAPTTSPSLAPVLSRFSDVLLFGLGGVGAALSVLVDNFLAARKRAGLVLSRNLVAGIAKIAVLYLAAPADPRALYLAVNLPALATTLAILPALRRVVPGFRLGTLRVDAMARAGAAFALRTTPSSLLSGAPQFVLPLIAVGCLSARHNAFFYLSWSMAQILYLVPSVISNITLSQGGDGRTGALSARALRFSLLLITPASVLGAAGAGLVLRLYGGEYSAAATPLRLLLVAALPWSVVIIAQGQLRIEHRFRAVTLLTACFCLTSLGLPLALAKTLGLSGMTTGWLAAVVTTAALAAWVSRTHRGRSAPQTVGGIR